jgi:hypothetical protein
MHLYEGGTRVSNPLSLIRLSLVIDAGCLRLHFSNEKWSLLGNLFIRTIGRLDKLIDGSAGRDDWQFASQQNGEYNNEEKDCLFAGSMINGFRHDVPVNA